MINREADGLFEALRLQKLRAVEYILDHIDSNQDEDIAVAVEILEDVYVKKENTETFEQNKNYDPNSTFSLNSEEILKSLCSFIDIWIYNNLSQGISFCFLSTNLMAKERKTKRSESLSIVFPTEKILEELGSKDIQRISNVGLITRNIITHYYKEKYPNEEQAIELLESMSDDSWIGFLLQINWVFSFPLVDELELNVIGKVKNCRYFSSYDNTGQEETIKIKLLDLIEKKTQKKDKIFKLMFLSDVQLIFSESSSSINNRNVSSDEVYTLWEGIEKPTDTRNLKEKILSVCPDFDESKLNILERQASIAKVGENRFKNSHKYLSLKYRVFTFCEKNLDAFIYENSTKKFTQEEISAIIDKINNGCILEFEDLKKEYDYGIERNSVILELFIEFIDSCYLAFD